MATVTPVLWKHKKNARGEHPIWLRFSDNRRDLYLSLGVFVKPKHWNPRQQRVRKSHPLTDDINDLIVERLTEAEREILRRKRLREPITAEVLKQVVVGREEATDFFAFAERHVATLHRRGNIARERRLRATLDKLRAFAGAPLPFEQITPQLLTDFETHCLTVLENRQTTVGTNLSDLRALYNRAVKEEVVDDATNPFRRFTIRRGKARERVKLTLAEVQALDDLDLDGGLAHARDFFLFAFYAAGIRFSDVLTMTHGRVIEGDDETPDRLVYRQGKTGARQSVMLTQQARRILGRYMTDDGDAEAFIFPMLRDYDLSTPQKLHNAKASQNTLVNRHLKTLAAMAGIDKSLSTHIARHSFADLARTSGLSIYDVSKLLGHSTIKQTETYLRGFDGEALDGAMTKMFGAEDG